ncbi:MAG: hypothetical protein ACRC3Z_13195 [Phocaeicola sp.]
MNELYTVAAWEAANTDQHTFTHFYYCDNGKEIRKVKGTVQTMQKKEVDGVRKWVLADRKVRWDHRGRCTMGTHNIRKRQFDIKLQGHESGRIN